MSLLPQNYIDSVLDRIDIVDVIDSRIQLKRGGKNWQALCPFHDEKSPSFSVSPQKQMFYCFGCGASGNAIGFVMRFEGLDFRVATTKLGQSVGLQLDDSAPKKVYVKNERKLRAILNSEIDLLKFYDATQKSGLVEITKEDNERADLARARIKKITETLQYAL